PTAPNPTQPDPTPPRPRGQQPDRPGPERRDYSQLPAIPEDHVLLPEQCRCPQCGLPFADFPGTEDSLILEVDVRAHRRVIRRHRYRPRCPCAAGPGLVTAPPPPRLLPKSLLGISIWVAVLLDKYLFYRPTYRLLADWETLGRDRALGTITDGLRRLAPLFEPVYEALVKHSQGQALWHADETRWLVFVSIEGKVGHRWYLWVFHGAEVVVFVLAVGRSHEVPEVNFGPVEGRGILVVDRYKAYQASMLLRVRALFSAIQFRPWVILPHGASCSIATRRSARASTPSPSGRRDMITRYTPSTASWPSP